MNATPKRQIYPLTKTGIGGKKQGKYEAWGHKGDGATIGRFYFEAAYVNHPDLSKGALMILNAVIMKCANHNVGIIPLSIPATRIMNLLKCDKYRASKVLKELLTAGLLKRLDPAKGKKMVILNHDLIERYEQEYLAQNQDLIEGYEQEI